MLSEPGFRFHHVGVACRSLAAELRHWERLGYAAEGDIFEDPLQKIRGIFILGGGPRLELLEPAGAGSPVEGFIRRGVKLYHQAFVAQDFDRALSDLATVGGKLVGPPAPAVAFHGRRIAFLMMPGLHLIEIIEADSTA